MSIYNKISNIIERNELLDMNKQELITLYNSATIEDKIQIVNLIIDTGYIDIAETLLNTEENDGAEFLFFRAEVAFFQGENDDAILYLDAIPKDSDVKINATLLEAEIYMNDGLVEVSERKLKSLETMIEDKGIVKLMLAEFYYDQQNYDTAYKYYFDVLTNEEYKDQVDFSKFATVSYEMGEFETALENFEKVKIPEQMEYEQILTYTELLVANEQFDKALALFQDHTKIADYVETGVYVRYIELLLSQDKLENAKKTLDIAQAKDDLNADLYFLRARVAFKELDLYKYEQNLYKVLEIKPQNFDALEMLSELKFKNGAYEEVKNLLSILESHGEYDISYDWMRAKIAVELEDFDEAQTYYNSIFDELKHDVFFLNDYALFNWENRNLEHVEKAIKHALNNELEFETLEYLQGQLGDENSD